MAGEDKGDLVATEEPGDSPDTLFDAGLARLFAEGSDDAPADDAPPADDEPEDTPAEGNPDDEPEDTDDEGEEEEEDEEEGDEEEEEEGEPEDEESEDSLTVTAEEKARIEKDPALKKLYRSMQGDYTRKTTAVKEREHAVERIETALRDPEKSADFMARIYERHPQVAANAFARVATGDNARDFLVAAGLHSPEVFEKAYDRVRELLDDTDALKRYKDQQAIDQDKSEVARQKAELRDERFRKARERITTIASQEADTLGIEPDETDDLTERLKELIKSRVKQDGSIELTRAEVRALVAREKTRIDEQYKRARIRARKKLAKETQDATKRKAKSAKERGPSGPAPVGRKPEKTRTKFKPRDGADPLDQYVDHRFGGEMTTSPAHEAEHR